ncbi:hypothetical protein [Streptomyces antimycoticus]|uniref:hypothetical protein n=1 Tax=Streptomyces antimycoticus TaxID=68175 RepID=UPI00118086F3|nr:hypothetical protein [Streptomyces antimycoticus]
MLAGELAPIMPPSFSTAGGLCVSVAVHMTAVNVISAIGAVLIKDFRGRSAAQTIEGYARGEADVSTS